MLCNQLNVPLTNGQTNCHKLLYDHSATYLNAPAWAHLELTRHNNSAQWSEPIRSSQVFVLTIVQPIWMSLSEPILSSRQQEFFIYSRSIMSSPDITRVVKSLTVSIYRWCHLPTSQLAPLTHQFLQFQNDEMHKIGENSHWVRLHTHGI